MAVTFSATPQFKAAETISTTDSPTMVGAGSQKTSYEIPVSISLVDTDSPGPDRIIGKKYTLDSGSPTTLDLTAAPRAFIDDVSYDLTGKKLLAYRFVTDPANTGTVTIAPGANGYDLFGASGQVIMQRGEWICGGMQKKTDGTLPTWGKDAVGASDKNITLSTSVTGSILTILMIFGD